MALPSPCAQYQASWCDRISAISAADWNALCGCDNPFLSHEFLNGLENTGCLDIRWGWRARHLLLHDTRDGSLAGAMPCYSKYNSFGEFVFDFAWAQAYLDAGLDYYPKLLCGVPHTPVNGARMLVARNSQAEAVRHALAAALIDECEAHRFSGVHVNFHAENEATALEAAGFLPRHDWQFHWHNADYGSFTDFLSQLRSNKRKKIRQERRKVHQLGLRFRQVTGTDLNGSDLRFAHACYQQTFLGKNNLPVLSLAFFFHLARTLPQHLLLIIAESCDRPVACAVFLYSDTHLYGRYWGCMESLPGLHFETCYYQGIEFAIQHGLAVFEPGAQGEHKIARGFVPRKTHSRHYLLHAGARRAVATWLVHERRALAQYHSQLCSHNPYRRSIPKSANVAASLSG